MPTSLQSTEPQATKHFFNTLKETEGDVEETKTKWNYSVP